MKGIFQIARIFGIPVQVHWTFGLLFPAVFFLGDHPNWSGTSFLWFTLIVVTLFSCVLLHEFGHALAARRFGVQTRDIILSPIGGVARLDRLPDQPFQEFAVAAAGPLVNLAIALITLPFLLAKPGVWQHLDRMVNPNNHFFFADLNLFDYFLLGVFLLNVILAGFNLLPAFPMDGGRILRALLSFRLGRPRATRIAVFLGKALAVGFVGYGIWDLSPVTAFIGFFVFITATDEYRIMREDALLENHRVGEIVRLAFTRMYLSDTIERPVEELTRSLERNFLVFDEWQNFTGTLSEENLLLAVRKKDFGEPVNTYMTPGREMLLPGDSLRYALHALQRHDNGILPVFNPHAGTIAGVIDLPAISNFLSVQEKMKKET